MLGSADYQDECRFSTVATVLKLTYAVSCCVEASLGDMEKCHGSQGFDHTKGVPCRLTWYFNQVDPTEFPECQGKCICTESGRPMGFTPSPSVTRSPKDPPCTRLWPCQCRALAVARRRGCTCGRSCDDYTKTSQRVQGASVCREGGFGSQ